MSGVEGSTALTVLASGEKTGALEGSNDPGAAMRDPQSGEGGSSGRCEGEGSCN